MNVTMKLGCIGKELKAFAVMQSSLTKLFVTNLLYIVDYFLSILTVPAGPPPPYVPSDQPAQRPKEHFDQ